MKIIIKGGGIAGCVAGICGLLNGDEVVIYEAKKMPRHKVCGEYVSLESAPILEQLLGIAITDYPLITRYTITDLLSKQVITGSLPLGGFGISRYELDLLLMNRFVEMGGKYNSNLRVVKEEAGDFTSIQLSDGSCVEAEFMLNASGKSVAKSNREAYVGLKYHIADNEEDDQIRLYLFEGGYFGSSRVENGMRCICFLMRQDLLVNGDGPQSVADKILTKNGLNHYLNLPDGKAHLISNFHFNQNSFPHSIGDANQLIPPLAGNGMSMAIADGLTAFDNITEQKHAKRRGVIQRLHHLAYKPFGAGLLTTTLMNKRIRQLLINQTHGQLI